MSLYVDFLKEYYNKDVIELDDRAILITLDISSTEIYWEDIYVHPDFRNSGAALELCNKALTMAESRGIKTIYGSADPKSAMFDRSMYLMNKFGFKISHVNGPLIVLKKEI